MGKCIKRDSKTRSFLYSLSALCRGLAAAIVAAWLLFLAIPLASADIDFNRQIRPILSDKCFVCHGPTEQEADLRFDEALGVFEDQNADVEGVIVRGDPNHSALIHRIAATDDDERMPPKGDPLTEDQVAVFRQWIKEGAVFESHWAFRGPVRPKQPQVENKGWSRNFIDDFIRVRLEAEGLSPSAAADKRILARRASLHLTGLPPTRDVMDAYLSDSREDAYERLVDKLLASPSYGEHMARSWLDVARYADTDGYQNDRIRTQWAWRDWLIEALNQNKRYDAFIIEQIAGDLLPDASLKQQIATGFNRNHRINSEDGSIAEEWRIEYVADRAETVGTAFMALTFSCCRCHDHKYDPLTQKEFYEFFAFFNQVDEAGVGTNGKGNAPPFVPLPESWPDLSPEEDKWIKPAPITYQKRTRKGGTLIRPVAGGKNTVMVMHDLKEPRSTYLLKRGEYDNPDRSETLQPSVPSVLGEMAADLPRNRLGLAKWLVRGDHPLTARVAVNRLWQGIFGVGIVSSAENFGSQAALPSHPELLDALAVEFVRNGWDVKWLLKQIVTSSTYRQSSAGDSQSWARDPNNRLLSRGPRHRMNAHVLRDHTLLVSGLLADRMYGPSVRPYMPPGIWDIANGPKYAPGKGADLYRRSLYTYWRRTIPPPTMMIFNSAAREMCEPYRPQTNTPLQALTLMNNVAFVEASRFLAERMITAEGVEAAIQLGFAHVMQRPAADHELRILVAAYERYWAKYEHDPESARAILAIGAKSRNAELDVIEHAALTMVASTILNMDEAITIE